jgi:hypothetical protein
MIMNTIGGFADAHDIHCDCTALQMAKEMDPGQWWFPEEVGCHPKIMTRSDVPVLRKECICKRPCRDYFARGTPKGCMFRKRRQMCLECKNYQKGQLCLRS